MRRVKVIVTGYYEIDMDDSEGDYGTTDPAEMLEIDKANADPCTIVHAFQLEDPTVTFKWDDSCNVLPNGECVSTNICVHSPR